MKHFVAVSFLVAFFAFSISVDGDTQVLSSIGQIAFLVENLIPSNFTNVNCVSKDCPESTKNHCPSVNDITSVIEVLNTLKVCATRKMCGLKLDPDMIWAQTFTTEGAPKLVNYANCSIPLGGSMTGLSEPQVIKATQDGQQLNISVEMANIEVFANMSCNPGPVNYSVYHKLKFEYNVLYDNTNNVTVTNLKITPLSLRFDILTPNGKVSHSITDFSKSDIDLNANAVVEPFIGFLQNLYQTFFNVAKKNCGKKSSGTSLSILINFIKNLFQGLFQIGR